MICAVIDTNVYVAALLSREGACARVVRALAEGLLDAVVCPSLLAELDAVLARPRIAQKVAPEVAQGYVRWLERVAITAADPQEIAAVSPDPADDYIVALARAASAQVIVSGNAHLLDIPHVQPRVVTPGAFAELVDELR